jgi:hypothetical protein
MEGVVLWQSCQAITVVGMRPEDCDEGILPGSGVQPFDPTGTQVPMLLEWRAACWETRIVQVSEESNTGPHREEQGICTPVGRAIQR